MLLNNMKDKKEQVLLFKKRHKSYSKCEETYLFSRPLCRYIVFLWQFGDHLIAFFSRNAQEIDKTPPNSHRLMN